MTVSSDPASVSTLDNGVQSPNIDALIGARIKSRRIALRISQTSLATSIGVRFQQVQKYENGTNRVSASRLLAVSDTLDVPISYFFRGLGPNEGDTEVAAPTLNALTNANVAEILALVETLPSDQQQAVLAFLRTLSDTKRRETQSDAAHIA